MLSNGVKTVAATSMLGVLSLGLKSGSEVHLTSEGGSEAANLEAVAQFIAQIKE